MFSFKTKMMVSSLLLLSFNSFSADEIHPEVELAVPEEVTGNIKFKGNITDSSCDVNVGKDQTVGLGNHSIALLKKNGDKIAEEKEFTVLITDCSLSMTSLRTKMEGMAHKDNQTLFALDEGEESAGNVGIWIGTKNGDQITAADGYREVDLQKGVSEYAQEYKATYQATGRATPGTANATVKYIISYE